MPQGSASARKIRTCRIGKRDTTGRKLSNTVLSLHYQFQSFRYLNNWNSCFVFSDEDLALYSDYQRWTDAELVKQGLKINRRASSLDDRNHGGEYGGEVGNRAQSCLFGLFWLSGAYCLTFLFCLPIHLWREVPVP